MKTSGEDNNLLTSPQGSSQGASSGKIELKEELERLKKEIDDRDRILRVKELEIERSS